MRRTLMVLVLFALVAFAGDFATGGAELTKFKGYGTFRWTSFGEEGNPVGNEFSDYLWMAWVPKINDHVSLCISAQNTTTGSSTTVLDQMYLDMKLTECLNLRGGQFKVPFGHAYTRSGGSMYFADRSVVGTGGQFMFYGGKDIGAMLTVNIAPVTVDLMLSNGTGNNTHPDTTTNKQFTARLAVDPAEWLTVGGSVAMIGRPDYTEDDVDFESWSSNGMDFFAVANYPVSPEGTLLFTGEYMILGYPAHDVDTWTLQDATSMSVMLGYKHELNGEVFQSILPAVRYDAVSPLASWQDDADEPENNKTIIDFCVNMGLFSEYNTLQIGARSNSFENDDVEEGGEEAYTDIYANWRINF